MRDGLSETFCFLSRDLYLNVTMPMHDARNVKYERRLEVKIESTKAYLFFLFFSFDKEVIFGNKLYLERHT